MAQDAAPDHAWLLAAVEESSDVLAVLRADTSIAWVSKAVRRLLGYAPADLVDRSIVELVHPDDLARAAEVIELAAGDRFGHDTPMTPALYRILDAGGQWKELEVNATTPPGADEGADILLLIRQSGDQVLNDRLLEEVIGGAPVEQQLDLVLELGVWRYPDEGYVVIVPDGADTAITRAAGVDDPLLCGHQPVTGPTPWALARQAGHRVTVEDLDDPALIDPALADAARAHGFDAVLAKPVTNPGHDTDACLVVWSTPAGPSVAGQRYPMANMVRALSLILQWRSHVRGLEQAANVDMLTGLATRQRFFTLAPEWLARGGTAVLYIDLDGFKAVNDHHGHSAGDHVLATTADRLATAVGEGGLIGRLGGDEFAVLCEPGMTATGIDQLAESLVAAAGEPIPLHAGPVTIGASVGVAHREDGESIDDLLERADTALFAAKAAGKGTWQAAGAGTS